MKKTLFSILAAGCIFSACTEKPKGTTLSGTITGVKSDTILVFISNPFVQGASYRTDTIALKEGKFSNYERFFFNESPNCCETFGKHGYGYAGT